VFNRGYMKIYKYIHAYKTCFLNGFKSCEEENVNGNKKKKLNVHFYLFSCVFEAHQDE